MNTPRHPPVQDSPPPAPASIPALTGIRGLAAAWVWLYHVWLVAGNRPVKVDIGLLQLNLTPLFSSGWVGVHLFFVLSGFVLSWPYFRGDRSFVFGDFMRRRALRVLPAYYAQFGLLLVLAALGYVVDLPSPGDALAHLLMLHNLRPEWSHAINAPWWTLPIEWQFYLVFPLLLLLIRPGMLWRGLALVLAIVLIWRMGAYAWLNQHHPDANVDMKVWLLGQLPGYLEQFFLGMLAAWWLASHWGAVQSPAWRRRFHRLGGGTSLATLAWIYLLAAYGDVYWQGHWLLFSWNSGLALLLAGFLLSLAVADGLPRALFANRYMLWLGEISYSLYLWHFIVLILMVHWGVFAPGTPDTLLARVALYSLLPVLGVAWLSWWLTERPFLRYRHERRRPQGSAMYRFISNPWAGFAILAGGLFVAAWGANHYWRPAQDQVAACSRRGAVDIPQVLSIMESPLRIAGWAYDWETYDRLKRVVAAQGGRDIGEAPLDQPRQDVREALAGCRVGTPGFEMRIPAGLLEASRREPLVVWAERRSGARYEIGRVAWPDETPAAGSAD